MQSQCSSYLIMWPTASEWIFCHSLITPHPVTTREWVTLPCTLIISHPMANSWWVTLLLFSAVQSHHHQQKVSDGILCHAVSSHLIPWSIVCEWDCPFFWGRLITYHPMKQDVRSDTAIFVCQVVSWVMSHPMINSGWVTCTAMESHHIFRVSFHDQQAASDTSLFFCHTVSLHIIPGPSLTACEWLHCPVFSARLWLIAWLIACEWHALFCHAVLSDLINNQQWVSNITLLFCGLITSLPMITVCEWYHLFYVKQSHHIPNREWVMASFLPSNLITSLPITHSG